MMIFQFVGIQIFSAMYLLLILIVYSYKKRYVSVENDIFRILLYFTIVELGIDIAVNYTIKYAELVSDLNSLMCKLSLFGYQIWAWLLMIYVLLLGNNKEYKNIKDLYIKSNKIKLWSIIAILCASVIFFLPLDYLYDQNFRISYVVGTCTLYTYGVCLIYLLIILMSAIVNKYKITILKRIPIFVFIITASIFLPIQRFNTDVPVLIVPLMAFAVMIMYFTLENPDLKLINELNILKSEAEESNRVKTEFLSNVSEDIRRPMNAIIGFSETLLMEDINAKAKSDAETIRIASSSLLEMINNILDISKIEAGSVQINNNEYSLKTVLNTLNNSVKNSLKNKVSFIKKVDEKIPYNLIGDEQKIIRVLENLLSNSIKYTEVGKITLSVNGDIINDKLLLKFKISDTGIGIKKEDYDKIFKKFSRVDNRLTENVEGTGLGLAMSKELISLMGGNIKFDSVFGGGTNFYIEITQEIKSFEEIGIYIFNNENEQKINIFDASDKKVLIVDNNKLNVRVLERMLEPYKINITSVFYGDDCINLIKSGNQYDLILLDDKMSDNNDVKLIKIMNDLDIVNNTKIIALTADSFVNNKSDFLSCSFDDLLLKPIDILRLSNLINKYLKK